MISKLSNYTVAHIHKVICDAGTLSMASKRLNLTDCTVLTCHLGKFLLYGEPLNIDSFKALSVEDARKLWGDAYAEQIASPEIDISRYNASHIHYLACKTNNIRNLASLLGVRDHTVKRYFNKFNIQGEVLTFERLKSLSVVEAFRVFGHEYEARYVEQRINLTPDVLQHRFHMDTLAIAECDAFSCQAAHFKHDFPLSYSLGCDIRVDGKRNIFDFFSESSPMYCEKELSVKKNRQDDQNFTR